MRGLIHLIILGGGDSSGLDLEDLLLSCLGSLLGSLLRWHLLIIYVL